MGDASHRWKYHQGTIVAFVLLFWHNGLFSSTHWPRIYVLAIIPSGRKQSYYLMEIAANKLNIGYIM